MNTEQPAADFQLRNLTFDQSCQLLKTIFSHEVNLSTLVVMTGLTSVLIGDHQFRVEIEMNEEGKVTWNPSILDGFEGDEAAVCVDKSAEVQQLLEEWGIDW